MKLELNPQKSPGPELRKLLLNLARRARKDIRSITEDPVEKVHRIRTDMKKIRSILRLIEPNPPSDAYSSAWDAASAIKELLARSRDAVVQSHLRNHKNPDAGKLPKHANPTKSEIAGASIHAEELMAAIKAIDLNDKSWDQLVSGMKQMHHRGVMAMNAAGASPTDSEKLHEWRKRVKDLWVQSSVLKGVSHHASEWRIPARDLGELLGREHDLSILIDQSSEKAATAAAVAERAVLREEIFSAGRGLYDQGLS